MANPTFRGIEIWNETCSVGSRVAWFDRRDLATAVVKRSLTGTESLSFTVARPRPPKRRKC